jgi:hypothetical protein
MISPARRTPHHRIAVTSVRSFNQLQKKKCLPPWCVLRSTVMLTVFCILYVMQTSMVLCSSVHTLKVVFFLFAGVREMTYEIQHQYDFLQVCFI